MKDTDIYRWSVRRHIYVPSTDSYSVVNEDVVLASDHDREMAKNSQLQREAYDAICERDKQIAELRSEVEALGKVYRSTCPECGYAGCVRGKKACDAELDRQSETIATQAKVIEKLREQRDALVPTALEEYATTEQVYDYRESLELDIAAIEKEGAKDEPNQR